MTDRLLLRSLSVLVPFFLATFSTSSQVFVDINNLSGSEDGVSWTTAYHSLQAGIDDAASAGEEVWVAKGIYTPTTTTDRRISFTMKPGVELYGGFVGTETSLSMRSWTSNVTTLNGDIGVPNDTTDNSFHVVVGASNATIDGFTISGGNADGQTYFSKGGGMVNYHNASPRVVNCIFTANRAFEGGAMYNYDMSAPHIETCAFEKNTAFRGGAMVNQYGSSPVITKCEFSGNFALWRGGAVFINYGSSPTMSECEFLNNSTDGNGGAVFVDDTESQFGGTYPIFTNCTFTYNIAGLRGGGLANYDKCTPTVEGSGFFFNRAGAGGGAISNDYFVAHATVDNCTFGGNDGGTGQDDIDCDGTSCVIVPPPGSCPCPPCPCPP